MDDLVEFPLEGGGTVLVRVAEPATSHDEGPLTRGGMLDRHDLPQRAARTLDESVRAVQPAAEALLTTLTRLSRVPDEINVEFAIELSAQAGAVIATLGSTANFKISLIWRASDADRAATTTP